MADITKWDAAKTRGLPASLFYDIPTGGARPNEWFERPSTYLSTLGEQRAEKPPVSWEDQPYKLNINPDMLNDPTFSQYDLSQLRTYEQDPRLRDEIDLGLARKEGLGISGTEYARSPELHARSAGFTYPKNFPGDYDPNKIYVDQLNDLKMAVGPGVEQAKQGIINKERASTIAHEFRHNLFADPKYSGIIDAAYHRFGGQEGNISRFDLEEYINRAADVQLMPESWLGETLDDYQDEYNRKLIRRGMPAHLTPMNTTKQFHRSAKEFFEKVRRQNLKKSTQRNIQKKQIGMPEHLTTYTPPKKTYVSPARPHSADPPSGNGGQRGSMPTGTAGRNPWGRAHGGLIDIPLSGRSRDI